MQSVSAILGLVKVPQIVVQCFFVFALETVAVSPDESIEYVVRVAGFLHDLDHACAVVWVGHLELAMDGFDLSFHAIYRQHRILECICKHSKGFSEPRILDLELVVGPLKAGVSIAVPSIGRAMIRESRFLLILLTAHE